MLLKIFGAFFICVGTWVLGKNLSLNYCARLDLIEKYILFLKSFKSAVCFSGINMYTFFEKYDCARIKPFLQYLIDKKDMEKIKDFKGENQQEDKCLDIIGNVLLLGQTSSDTKAISDFSDEAVLQLSRYKKEFLEEYNGKIKTAPAIGLVVGMFVAVLIL